MEGNEIKNIQHVEQIDNWKRKHFRILGIMIFIILYLASASFPSDDHGDEFKLATEISLGIVKSGIVTTPTDKDYFKFTISEKDTYIITISTFPGITVRLFDSFYNELSGRKIDEIDELYHIKIIRKLDPGTFFLEFTLINEIQNISYSFLIQNITSYEKENRKNKHPHRFPEFRELYKPMPIPDENKRKLKPLEGDPNKPNSYKFE